MVGSLRLAASLATAAAATAARAVPQARAAGALAPQRAASVAAVFAPRPKRAQTARRCFFSSAAQSGLQKEVVVEGSGASPKQGDRV